MVNITIFANRLTANIVTSIAEAGFSQQATRHYRRAGAFKDTRVNVSGATYREEPKHNRDISEVVVSSSKGEATQSFHALFSRSAKAGLFKNAVEEVVAGVTVTGQYDLASASSILSRLRELSLLYAEGNK